MRIAVGFVVLADLIIRATSISAHYTDQGVLPVDVLKEFYPKVFSFSFHNLSGELWWQCFLFSLNAIVAIALIIGYRTRLITFLAWALMVSLHYHNPFIQQAGDDLLRMVLFFAVFLPWGNFYSFDAKKTNRTYKNYSSVAGFGYLLLIASVYFFSALYKTSPEWRSEGTAIYYALSLDQLRLGFGHWLYQYPGLMKVLTFFVFYAELIAPLLLFIPFKKGLFRFIGLSIIILLHLGFCSSIYVGFFYIIGITSTFGLLPSAQMNRLEKKWVKTKSVITNSYFRLRNINRLTQISLLLKNMFLSLIIFLCLLINLSRIKSFPYTANAVFEPIVNFFKLEQYWGMFSPHILKDDGWYVYMGIKQGGTFWDIYNDKPNIDSIKPMNVLSMYETDRWRKFAENYQNNQYNFLRPYYCKYFIKRWNKKHPDNKMIGLYIYFMKEESLLGYKTKPIEKQNICLCYENDLFK